MTSPSSIFSSSLFFEQGSLLGRATRRLAGWLVAATVVLGSLEIWYRARPLTELDETIAQLDRRAGEVEILVLGGSRLREGVVPHLLGRAAFNMAHDSQTIWYDTQMLERYAGRLPRLHTVVWGLEPISLGFDLAAFPDGRQLLLLYDRYSPRQGPPPPPSERVASRVAILRVRGPNPLRTLYTRLRMAAGGDRSPLPHRSDGFFPREVVPEDLGTAQERAEFHRALIRADWIEEDRERAARYVRRLRDRGVRVVFVTAPVSPMYRAALGPEFLQRFQAERERLLEESGAEAMDLSDAVPPGRGYYSDPDHVQGEGAERFSRELSRLLEAPPHAPTRVARRGW